MDYNFLNLASAFIWLYNALIVIETEFAGEVIPVIIFLIASAFFFNQYFKGLLK